MRVHHSRPASDHGAAARVLLVAICAVLLAACGGPTATTAPTAAPTAAPAAQPTVAVTAAPTAPPTASPTPAPAAAPTAPPTAAPTASLTAAPPAISQTAAPTAAAATPTGLPSVPDLTLVGTALSNKDSYKVTIHTEGGAGTTDASFTIIKKPSFAEQFETTSGGKTVRLVIIGTDVWFDPGTGTYLMNAVPASVVSALTGAMDPASFLAAANTAGQLASLVVSGVESKNGIDAIHLQADENTPVPAGKPTLPPGATIDLWISAEEPPYIVALEFVNLPGSGGALSSGQIEVSNVNDPSLTVSPPS